MDSRVQKIQKMMRDNLDRELPLIELAQSVNLSPWRLCHLFRADAGMPPIKYLRLLRLEAAKQLLETSFLSIKEITFKVGVNDESHFVRDFKRVYGKPPSVYRMVFTERMNEPENKSLRSMRTTKEKPMKRIFTFKIFLILFASLSISAVFFSNSEASTTTHVAPQATCSNATLTGQYRYTFSGVGFPGNASANASARQFAAVGIITFSGDGTHFGADTISFLGGNIESRRYDGSYSVNADCRGTFCLQTGPSGECFGPADIVVAPDGSEMLFINTIPHTAVLGEFKKQ